MSIVDHKCRLIGSALRPVDNQECDLCIYNCTYKDKQNGTKVKACSIWRNPFGEDEWGQRMVEE